MKKLRAVLFSATTFASASAFSAPSYDAIWTKVYHKQLDPKSTVDYYIESTTVSRSSHTVAFWDKIVMEWIGRDPGIVISHVIVNCETQEVGTNAYASDEKGLYEGKIIGGGPVKWEVASPNSGLMVEVQTVCR